MSIEWEVPPQEPEAIRWGRIAAIVGGTIALFAAAVVIVWIMGVALAQARNPARQQIPARLGDRTINLLEQVPTPIAMHGYSLRDEQLRRLDGYGWVDRARGVVHVPVEVEMDRMARDAREAERGGGGR